MALLWPILTNAFRHWNRTAVCDDRGHYTYGQIIGGAMFLAEKIETVTAARQVGLLLPTSGAAPIAILGCWLAGRVPVPLNYLLAREELAYIIRDSGIDTLITVGPMLDFLGGAQNLPGNIRLLRLDELNTHATPPLRWPPLPAADDPAVILYTSGTSAKPKGVVLTHDNLHTNVDAGIQHAGITQATAFLGILPQFHSFGLTVLTLMPLYAGCRVVYSARFIPKRVIELLRQHKPTIFVAVPSMYTALLSVKEARPEDFASVRMPVSGGEALPNSVFEAFQERFGVRLLEGYGLTETAPVLTWCTPERWKLHSVGPALPGVEIVIVDERDQALPPGQDGEILAHGPNVMQGYYRLPEQTARVFTTITRPGPNGPIRRRFFRTGDIGRMDAAGFLYITGRKKEMLKVAGEIVFPRDVEEVLNQHPAVRESAVIGRPDSLRGEAPVAFVEIRENQMFDEIALRDFCRQHMAGFKVPREIHRLDALPRNATGKVLKRSLRAN